MCQSLLFTFSRRGVFFFLSYFLACNILQHPRALSHRKINGLQCKQCVLFAFMIYLAMVYFIAHAQNCCTTREILAWHVHTRPRAQNADGPNRVRRVVFFLAVYCLRVRVVVVKSVHENYIHTHTHQHKGAIRTTFI